MAIQPGAGAGGGAGGGLGSPRPRAARGPGARRQQVRARSKFGGKTSASNEGPAAGLGGAAARLARCALLAVLGHGRQRVVGDRLQDEAGPGEHGVGVLQLPHLQGRALRRHLLLGQPLVGHQDVVGRDLGRCVLGGGECVCV